MDIVELLKQAAEQGDAAAQYYLGLMYANGKGVAQNNAEAKYWFTLAAYQRNADAQFYLGLLCDLAQDLAEAVKWYTKAAEQGHKKAQYALDDMN